jgi:linearmycin/streptolysin S transport system permease protein
MSVLAIAATSIRRLLRDRRALLFLIVLPVLMILILGNSIRSFSNFKVGVVDLGGGVAGRQLASELRRTSDLTVSTYPSVSAATLGVARGEVSVVVVEPQGMDARLRAGGVVRVGVMSELANSTQQAAVTSVDSVIADAASRIQAAQFASAQSDGAYPGDLRLADDLVGRIQAVSVVVHQAESSRSQLPPGFSYSAPTMLVLFVFISALSGGAMIVEVRQMRLYERMMAAPLGAGTIVAGEFLALLTIALMQSGLIVGLGASVFGVSWGSPPAAGALVLVWSVVAASVGMLGGTLYRTPEQASALAPTLGILLGMLGGCMWPLSIVSTAFREAGHATPQAWAVDAWTDLLSRGGTLRTIAVPVAVLAGFALAALGVASRRLRRWVT